MKTLSKYLPILLLLIGNTISKSFIEEKFDGWRLELGKNIVGEKKDAVSDYKININQVLETGKGNDFTGFDFDADMTDYEEKSVIKYLIISSLYSFKAEPTQESDIEKFDQQIASSAKELLQYGDLDDEKGRVQYHLAAKKAYENLSNFLWRTYWGFQKEDNFLDIKEVDATINYYSGMLEKNGLKEVETYLNFSAMKECFREAITENGGILVDRTFSKPLEEKINALIDSSPQSSTLKNLSGLDSIKYYQNKESFSFDSRADKAKQVVLGIYEDLELNNEYFRTQSENLEKLGYAQRSFRDEFYLRTLARLFGNYNLFETTFIGDYNGEINNIVDYSRRQSGFNSTEEAQRVFENLLYYNTTGSDVDIRNLDFSEKLHFDKDATKHHAAWHVFKAAFAANELNRLSNFKESKVKIENGEITKDYRRLIDEVRLHAIKAVGAFNEPILRVILGHSLRNAEFIRSLDRTQANPNFLRDYLDPELDTTQKHSIFPNRTTLSAYQVLPNMTSEEVEHITKLGAFVESFYATIEHPKRVQGRSYTPGEKIISYGDKVRQVAYSKLREADHYILEDKNGNKKVINQGKRDDRIQNLGDFRLYKKPEGMKDKLNTIEYNDQSLVDNATISAHHEWYEWAVAENILGTAIGPQAELVEKIYSWSEKLLADITVYGKDARRFDVEFQTFSTAPDGNCGFYTADLETRCKEMGNPRLLTLALGNLDYIKNHKDDIYKHYFDFVKTISNKNNKYARSRHTSKGGWNTFEDLKANAKFINWFFGKQLDEKKVVPNDYEPTLKKDNLIDRLTKDNIIEELVEASFSYSSSDWYAYAEGKEIILSWLLDFIPVAWHVTDVAHRRVESFGLPVNKNSTMQEKHLYASNSATHDMKMVPLHKDNILAIIRGWRANVKYALGGSYDDILDPEFHKGKFAAWFTK